MQRKDVIHIISGTVLILLIPLFAMQFTDQVSWDITDFIVAGILLLSVGLAFKFFTKKGRSSTQRIIIGLIVVIVFLLIWAELAVGVFGTPWAGS